jgi:nicotinamide-nucleotide amidase
MLKLAGKVGASLKKRNQMLVTAESCTGGWVAQAVTSVAGSSDWFERGYVTYSNAAKREVLGVRLQTLRRYGAVSEQTARDMALGAIRRTRGALRRSRGTISVAVTGIAGPAGGSPDKPVGTVCFAWAQGRKLRSETRRFGGNRAAVRRKSVIHALRGLFRWL